MRQAPARSPDAQPALYVHGLGGSSNDWTDLAYLLAPRLDGHAIDLPGFGLSEPADRYGVVPAASRVIRWIEHSDRGAVHLFGNSFGGAVCAYVAGVRPDLVRTLTLISPAMPFFDPRRSRQSRLLPLLLVPGAERMVARKLATVPPEVMAREMIAICFAEPDRMTGRRLAAAVEEAARRYDAPWHVPAYLRTLRALVASFVRAYLPGKGSLWRVAGRVTAPTLVITGSHDRLVDVRVAPAVAKVIPDSRLLVLDRTGHVAQMEQPDIVARAVLAMLDEASAQAEPVDAVEPVRTIPRLGEFDPFARLSPDMP